MCVCVVCVFVCVFSSISLIISVVKYRSAVKKWDTLAHLAVHRAWLFFTRKQRRKCT